MLIGLQLRVIVASNVKSLPFKSHSDGLPFSLTSVQPQMLAL